MSAAKKKKSVKRKATKKKVTKKKVVKKRATKKAPVKKRVAKKKVTRKKTSKKACKATKRKASSAKGKDKTAEQSKEHARGRADHLKPHWWKPGQSGNLSGRPKGSVGLHGRIQKKLQEKLKSGEEGRVFADALADQIAMAMLRDPIKAERLIARFIDRDEGPIDTKVLVEGGVTIENLAIALDAIEELEEEQEA